MRTYKIEGIIIKRIASGEADRIITLMTKKHGKLRVKANGVRKITSRRSSHVELLNHCSMTVYKGRALPIITEVTAVETFPHIKRDLKKIGFAYHICELIDSLCAENQDNEQIYALLLGLFGDAFAKEEFSREVISFEQKVLEVLGFWPRNKELSSTHSSLLIESILERKLKTKRMLHRFS